MLLPYLGWSSPFSSSPDPLRLMYQHLQEAFLSPPHCLGWLLYLFLCLKEPAWGRRNRGTGIFQAEKSRSTDSDWKKPVPTESVVEWVFKPTWERTGDVMGNEKRKLVTDRNKSRISWSHLLRSKFWTELFSNQLGKEKSGKSKIFFQMANYEFWWDSRGQ